MLRQFPNPNQRSAVKRTPGGSSAAPASNSVFSSISLKNPSASPPGGGSGNPFGGFAFGSSAPSAAPAASSPATAKTPAFPSFAMPAASAKPVATTTKPTTTSTATAKKTGNYTENEKEIVKCAQGFVKHMDNAKVFDLVATQRFLTTFGKLVQKEAGTSTSKKTTPSSGTTTNWDSSRPLFGGSKTLISPTAGGASDKPAAAPTPAFKFGASASDKPAAAPAFSFGASASSPTPATGGFSFNPTKTGAASAQVPAFSFSTTPSAAVKAAAETAAKETASASKPKEGDTGDDAEKNEEDGDGVLEAADDDYQVFFKTKTKILHVRESRYIKGVLKLEQHKESKKNRLVVRDSAVGRVKMNTAVTKGMPVSKTIVPATKKKGPTPIVLITAVFDESTKDTVGPEAFKIITSTEDHEKLYDELMKLV